MEVVGGVLPGEGADGVEWRWVRSGVFTVKSTYRLLIDGGLREYSFYHVWHLRMPSKVKIFVWLALKNRLLTTDNLTRRGWTVNQLCVLCGDHFETINHLLLGCLYSRFVFGSVEEGPGFEVLGAELPEVWESRPRGGAFNDRNGFLTLLAAHWWVIWNCRNKTIFQQRNTDPLYAAASVRSLLAHWINLS